MWALPTSCSNVWGDVQWLMSSLVYILWNAWAVYWPPDEALNAEPPPNYQSTTMNQILRADREVIMDLHVVSDIRPVADGSKPLDASLKEALSDYNVAFHLLPLPLSHAGGYAPYRTKDGPSPRDESSTGFTTNKKGKGKQKGGAKGSSVAPRT